MNWKEANAIASEFCDRFEPMLNELRAKLETEGYRMLFHTTSDGKVEVSVIKIEQSRSV